MLNLNSLNGADKILLKYAERLLTETTEPLIGAELGIAYGGGVEQIGEIWKGRGTIYGLDTFEGHPKQLSYSQSSHEAYCMDLQYERYGTEKLSYEYQRSELDKKGLSNVILKKGLINEKSLSDVPYLNYVLLDLDMVNPMFIAFTIADPLIKSGGYLCLHDVTPAGHIFGLWGMFQEILNTGRYKLVEESHSSYLAVLQKI